MFKWFIPTVIAVICGLITLMGALVPIPVLGDLRQILVRWAAVITVFAFILAYSSILKVHISRTLRKSKDRMASIILLISAVASLIIVIIQGPEGYLSQFMVRNILLPGESALLALTAVTLILAGMRLFRIRRDVFGIIFFVVAVLALFGTVPYFYNAFIDLLMQIMESAATAGMRGLLLGVVLGTTLTGIRIIFGIDRPYSQE
jgi:hypothetical protein